MRSENFRFQISDFRLPNSDDVVSDERGVVSESADLRLQIEDNCRFQINFRLQIADRR